MNNEMIVFWNNGVDKLTLINFFLKISILLTLIQILLTTFIVPKSQEFGRTFIKSEINANSELEICFFKLEILNFSSTNKTTLDRLFLSLLFL